jgi:hypothetical protein
MRSSDNPKDIGTKLGPKLVTIISETIVATKRKLLHTEHQARVLSMQEVIDRAGREIADLYKPVWDETLAQQDMPDTIREHVAKIVSGKHQWQAIAGIAFGSSGAASMLSQIVSNYLAPAVRATLQASPELIPPVNDIVNMYVRGAIDLQEALTDIAGQGINNNLAQSLFAAAYGYPDLSTTLELLRRNMILPQDAGFYLTRSGISPDVQDQLLELTKILLSPPDLADMVVRGVKTHDEGAALAKQSGVDAADFDAMVLITGEPPGLQQMLEGYRRGFIDKATLERGIRESRYRNEWIPLLEQLRFSPMSVADAVNAVVQNHLSASEGNAISEQNGLAPGAFDILIQTAGEPLSRTEMEQLYNRGLVTEQQVKQALLESRVKNKYVDLAFQLHRKIPPTNLLQRALRYGVITHADAIRSIMDDGYSEADANILVKSASAEKLHTYSNRVVSAIETAYEENTIPVDQAKAMIVSLGYEDSEAAFILQAAEFRRSARIVNQVAENVKGRYVAHIITRVQASNDLDAIGIPATQRDYMLSLWDIEASAHIRHLTEAQVVKAVHKQLITPDDGAARLVAMGYSADDADLLLKGA